MKLVRIETEIGRDENQEIDLANWILRIVSTVWTDINRPFFSQSVRKRMVPRNYQKMKSP